MSGPVHQLLPTLKPMSCSLLQLVQNQEETKLADRPDFDFWPALVNMFAVLALVIGLIVLLGWLLRRFGGARFGGGMSGSGLMRLVSMLPLGEKRSLAVVRVGRRYFLIGVAGSELSNLGELEAEEVEQAMESESSAAEEGGFAAVFRRMRRGKGGEDA